MLEKVIDIAGRHFTLRNEGNAWEIGYGVSFENDEGRRCTVQFGVHLTSSMDLVSIPYKIHGTISQEDFLTSKEIVRAELDKNPNVFHIVENGLYQRDRLKRALQQALRYNQVTPSDPEASAIETRISDLTAIIRASHEWAENLTRVSFKDFLTEYRLKNFELPSLPVPDQGFIAPPKGLYELVSYAREREAEFGKIVTIGTGETLSRLPTSSVDHRDYQWPLPWTFPADETKWVNLVQRDFSTGGSVRAQDVLSSEDTLVLVWTRRTDRVAFERIASVIGNNGNDPHVLIGSPEGTISGRANAIRLAMEVEATPAPAI